MKLKEMILYDIELFQKECKEPDHSDYMMFVDFIIKNYQIPHEEVLNTKLYLEKCMKSWLKKHEITL